MNNKFFDINDNAFDVNFEEKKKSNFVKTNYFKPNTGENRIRILPPFKENGRPFVYVLAHSMLSLRNDEYGTVQTVNPVCFDFLFAQENVDLLKLAIEKDIIKPTDAKLYKANKGCPICQIAKYAWNVANTADKQSEKYKNYSAIAKRASTQQKYFFNIFDRQDNEVKVYNCSSHIFNKIKEEFRLCKEEGVNIFDISKGRDALLKKIVNGGRISYDISFERKNSKLGSDVEPYNLDNIAVYGVKDYITMLDVINSTESLGSFVNQHKITFVEML